MNRVRMLAASALTVLLLGGCGMYGDLYLEGEAPPPEVTPEDAPGITPEITEEPPILLKEPADQGDGTPGEATPDEDRPDKDQPDEDGPAGAA